MLLAGFDLETTGFDGTKDHIVQYSFQLFDDETLVLNESSLVNPEVEITTSEIHGIYNSDVVDAPKELDSLLSIDSFFVSCYRNNIPVVVMNAKFDITFYRNCMMTHFGLTPTSDYLILDPMVIDKQFDKYRSGKRNLHALALHYGIETSRSFHSADYDVKVSIDVARAQMLKWCLGTHWAGLHKLQSLWSDAQTKSLYDYFISAGNDAYKNMKLGWPIETSLIM